MPKLDKATKEWRDRGAITGIRKHFKKWAGGKPMEIRGAMHDEDTLSAPFEAHLRALQRVHELTIERSVAVAHERKLWAELQPYYEAWSYLAIARFGKHSPNLRAVGVEPHKEQTMSAETKAQAVLKRAETRKRLGIMGKKQRHFAKKKLKGG